MAHRKVDGDVLLEQLKVIEAELSALGFEHDPSKPVPQVATAFGYGVMALEQWLADVFLPNARTAIEEDRVPANSQVGVAAMRSFDGEPEKEQLVSLLSSFDQAIVGYNQAYGQSGGAKSSWWNKLLGR